jgi:hypothetical protein
MVRLELNVSAACTDMKYRAIIFDINMNYKHEPMSRLLFGCFFMDTQTRGIGASNLVVDVRVDNSIQNALGHNKFGVLHAFQMQLCAHIRERDL